MGSQYSIGSPNIPNMIINGPFSPTEKWKMNVHFSLQCAPEIKSETENFIPFYRVVTVVVGRLRTEWCMIWVCHVGTSSLCGWTTLWVHRSVWACVQPWSVKDMTTRWPAFLFLVSSAASNFARNKWCGASESFFSAAWGNPVCLLRWQEPTFCIHSCHPSIWFSFQETGPQVQDSTSSSSP